jgi:uncharacterized protein YjiS (DUF1127 family)
MFNRLHSIVAKWQERAALARELYSMTDRDLADIGISVTDIPMVLNGEFARSDLNAAKQTVQPPAGKQRSQMSGSIPKVA